MTSRVLFGISAALALLSACATASGQSPTPAVVGASPTPTLPAQASVAPTLHKPDTSPTAPVAAPTPAALQATTQMALAGTSIADVLRSDESCTLPCWRHLTPGRSSVEDLRQLLAAMGVNLADVEFTASGMDTPWLILGDTRPPLEIAVEASYDNDLVTRLELLFQGTSNLGAIEMRSLHQLLGTPSRILFERPQVVQRVFLDYPHQGILLRLSMRYHGDVCLPAELTPATLVILYPPEEGDGVIESNIAVDWANSLGITTDSLWQSLQDPTECIPPAY